MLELSASPVPHIPAALSDLRASSCMLLVPGSPLAGAELLDGLVLHHRLRSPDMPRSLSPARLLVLSSRLEDGDGAMPAVMQVRCLP